VAATISNRALTGYSGDTPSDLFVRPIEVDWTAKLKNTRTPYLTAIGRAPANKMPRLKEEFGWGSPVATTTLLNGALDASQTNVTVDDASLFQVGATFRIESEIFLAVGINETTNVVTVATRPYGGSAATHVDNMSVTIMSNAISENQATPLSPIAQGEMDYNYYQQIEESIQLSHRAEVIPTYETANVSDLNDRSGGLLKRKMMWEIPLKMENTLLYGVRTLGSTTSASSMGGILSTSGYVTTRNTSISGALTETTFLDNIQTAWILVGGDQLGRTVMAHPFVIRILSSFYNDMRRMTATEDSVRTNITKVMTDFGEFTFMANERMLKDAANGQTVDPTLLVFNPSDIKMKPLSGDSGWHTAELPEEGWITRGAIRGDWTQIPQNPDSRVLLGGFSVTSSDYPSLS